MEAEPYSVSTEKLIVGQGQPQVHQQMQPLVQQKNATPSTATTFIIFFNFFLEIFFCYKLGFTHIYFIGGISS